MENLHIERLTRRSIRGSSPTSSLRRYENNELLTDSEDEVDIDDISESDEDTRPVVNLSRASSGLSSPNTTLNGSRRSFNSDRDQSFKQEDSPQQPVPLIVIILAIVALAILLYIYLRPAPAMVSTSNELNIINELNNTFKQQSERSIKVIKGALRYVLNSGPNYEPTRPAIVLLISSVSAEQVMYCIAKHLARSTSNGSHLTMDGMKLKHLNNEVIKEKINNEIDKTFGGEKINVMLFDNLDLIPADAAMMFHSYCDSENAPFKRAIFIFTVQGKEKIPKDVNFKTMDQYAQTHLTKVWRTMQTDQLQPLITRLTVSVAMVVPEELPAMC